MNKNNHFSFKEDKDINRSINRHTLEHPQVCWILDGDNYKPKSFFALGYLLDQDRSKEKYLQPKDERVISNFEPLIIPKTSK